MNIKDHPRYYYTSLKIKLRPFALEVKRNPGLALRPSDKLLDSLSDKEAPFFQEVMKDLGLWQNHEGYWERANW